ncbi:MAG: xylulokinase [Bauldia sp.]|uniref:xylulokinase n=1 Tax=Bauldia sp. TaxID=2575872 RepID=UPI001D7878C0|nr:FGGY family carbohydrate kinase [Bauldia sp.]MCB1497371.1 xylulokinase [Bauldia sp.]
MFLGIDLGTGSVKALLIDETGRPVAEASRAYELRSPVPGHAETDPELWWSKTVEAVREACAEHGEAVRGIGLSGQGHGFVLADAQGTPLRPAILWPDLRTRQEVQDALALDGDLRLSLCNPVATGMAGLGLLWLKRHEPALLGQASVALSPKDWLRLRLTGERATEPADASMTLLYDMGNDGWAEPFAESLGVDLSLLPPLRASTDVAGGLAGPAASALRLPRGIPVAHGLSDTAACLLGLGQTAPGETVLQVGSGIQMMAVVDRATPELQPFYNTFRGVGAGIYKMAALQNGGTVFEWARRVLGAEWTEMYARAFAPGVDNGGAVFLPYVSGERAPLLDPQASAVWSDMRLGAGRDQIIRSVFEGVALAVRDSWDALKATGVEASSMLLTGGGATDPRWRQMLADIVGVPMRPFQGRDAAALGAAYIGGMAAGHWGGISELPFITSSEPLLEPRPFPGLDDLLARFRATYRALKSNRDV